MRPPRRYSPRAFPERLLGAESGHSTTRVRAERLRSSLWPSTLKELAAHMGGAGSPSL